MSDAKRNPDDISREQLLEQILEVFGKKQEPGDPPLESLPPSRRLIPHSPLNEREEDVIMWADCRWYGIKPAPPDHPVYKQGWMISLVPNSKQDAWPGSPESQAVEEPDDRKEDKTRS